MDVHSSNAVKATYTWGLDLSGLSGSPGSAGIHGAGGIGGLLAVNETAAEGSPSYWYLYDGNGNVGQLLPTTKDLNGAIVSVSSTPAAKYEYDPYGNPIVIHDTDDSGIAYTNPFRFSTKWFDDETSLGYWGYRYYSQKLGRWMSRDPIEEKDALNLYTFVENNTLNLVDPDGLKVISQSMSIPIPLFIPWPSLEFLGGIQACKDALSAVMTDLIGNAFGWRERFPGKSDHFYHCYHSCKIATACGDNLSMFLGSLRESFQQFLDNEGSLEDMISNVDGITCGKKKCPRPNRVQQCIDCCNNAMGVPR